MAKHRQVTGRFLRPPVTALICCVFLINAFASDESRASEPDAPKQITIPERKPVTRLLRLKHRWTGERIDIVYKIGDHYQPDAMAQISWFMRDWRCKKAIDIDPRLIDRLYDLQMTIGKYRRISVISAYRSEGYNASLLRAGRIVDPNSQHMFGRAVDIYVSGFGADRLRREAEKHDAGGTGYYPFSGPRFVHLDTGPTRHWKEMDPAVRRRMNLPKRTRKPLKLDCTLTMDEALRDIPLSDVIGALPEGAVAEPALKIQRARLALSDSPVDDQSEGDSIALDRQGPGIDRNEPCEIGNPSQKLDPVSLLRDPQRR